MSFEIHYADPLAVPRIRRGIGEIKPIASWRAGWNQLLGRPTGLYPGRRALVTYDRNSGAVQMRLLKSTGHLGPVHPLGNVRVTDLLKQGLTDARFGNAIENRVRNLVLWATGRTPRWGRRVKSPSAVGPDIIFREYQL